jgi:hypothetical protein
MEIHTPHEPVRSLSDFLYHMLTVVLGILIALGLEGLLQFIEHRHLVEETRVSLNEEVHRNEAVLSGGLKLAPDASARLLAILKKTQQVRLSHKPAGNSLDASFGLFVLSSVNWNTAQSSGALQYMDAAEIEEYTRTYNVQQAFNNIQDQTLQKWLEVQKWSPILDGRGDFNALTEAELTTIEQGVASAILFTRTEVGTATSLVEDYKKLLAKEKQ